jgi:hypothetical protein
MNSQKLPSIYSFSSSLNCGKDQWFWDDVPEQNKWRANRRVKANAILMARNGWHTKNFQIFCVFILNKWENTKTRRRRRGNNPFNHHHKNGSKRGGTFKVSIFKYSKYLNVIQVFLEVSLQWSRKHSKMHSKGDSFQERNVSDAWESCVGGWTLLQNNECFLVFYCVLFGENCRWLISFH